jgi:hypothetical protein
MLMLPPLEVMFVVAVPWASSTLPLLAVRLTPPDPDSRVVATAAVLALLLMTMLPPAATNSKPPVPEVVIPIGLPPVEFIRLMPSPMFVVVSILKLTLGCITIL